MTSHSKNDNRIIGFDGLRVYAILMIVACHTKMFTESAGGVGNSIFFSLSGFLVYYSLKNVKNIKDIGFFYVKRLLRIVPVTWAVLLIIWRMIPGVFSLTDFSTDHSLILNMLFIRGYEHLWFLQHLMLMYLIAPLIWLIYKVIYKAVSKTSLPGIWAYLFPAVLLIIIAVIMKLFLTADVLTMAGNGNHSQFRGWMFILGFATAILGEAFKNEIKIQKHSGVFHALKVFTNVYTVLFLLIFTISVVPIVYEFGYLSVFDNRMVRLACDLVLLFLLSVTKDTFVAKALDCKLLVKLSALSFGIYLWHFFFISFFVTGNGIHSFIFDLFISICLSLFTYTVVEKNAQKLVRRIGEKRK